MHQILKRNWDKSKYLILSVILITFILLLTVVYKSDEKIIRKSMIPEISYNNEVIDLTPKEYELLKTLIYQSHKVLSKSEITEQKSE